MSAENLAAAERLFASLLLDQFRPRWLGGFARAWKDWDDAPDRLRRTVGRVADALIATVDPARIPATLDREVFRIQAFKLIREQGGDALATARAIAAVEPPRSMNRAGWYWGIHRGSSGDPSSAAWDRVFLGLVSTIRWDVIVDAWAGLTPSSQAALAGAVGPAPAALDAPEAFAWLDWAADRPRPPEWRDVVALRGLSAEEGERLAALAVEQQESWQAGKVFGRPGSVREIRDVAQDFANQLHGWHGPHSVATMHRYARAGLRIYTLHSPPGDAEAEDEMPFYRDGFELLPAGEVDEVSPAVRAGHGEPLAVPGRAEPLAVVLDLDLTSPELAFLGLEGTRLRVCHSTSSRANGEFFTRVGLDGSVAPMGGATVDPGGGEPPNLLPPLVLGPRLPPPAIPDLPGLTWSRCRDVIGGLPSWEHVSEVPASPADGRPMTFLAQFPSPGGGTAYAFLDRENLIAAVVAQCDCRGGELPPPGPGG